MKSPSITQNFTSDTFILHSDLDLSFKHSNFVPSFIRTTEYIVIPPIFTADIPVGPIIYYSYSGVLSF